ncbi:pterin-4-alpha-carbinolamine dehydratase [Alkalihalobacillus alcalophilus ATCC 27647 = CGMCC 1.3604]|uniref:4a-hydroxytetrahydrobiopterin dehydratase n=1 Tax=Alkalihalobacillus alcalophilus ATCC 27647 = CGMCC 1.3604 TaxID=1218173 RepID=A0A094WQ23_ALKAL|nr:4a-hydroxytetrahydrobiopterin dehydratase [Alkalihalobacillus alcalophilus]KGA98921.1 pterin-4-alpha-carbinolamine dehydratase [Alkalihalobacillus alcalophilus ATCC 27647 = CGMCC 1.3604]MED1561953.1 4a-hydroxytetrahydrobiopterin dehydratase [Alkalihalobacillus alcalophilus]THG88458.1 pterin-4-alpha-carbinolamine dehydratase [Alkalihalobacillus alcalophilus ATCC 27647 = CGMCC 1.3604]
MKKLNEQEITEQLTLVPKWKRKETKWIERRYRFNEFLDGITFVNNVSTIAERENHHPFIQIQYKMVILSLSSWNENGLTDLDFQLAQEMDELFVEQTKTSNH